MKHDPITFHSGYSTSVSEPHAAAGRAAEPWLDRICEMIEATALGEWAFNPETDLDAQPEKLRIALAKLMARVSTLLRASERAALTDPATALDNSVSFRRLVEAEIHESGATRAVGAIIYLGLDSFQKINDQLEFWERDRLLQAIAGRLRLAADWCRDLRPNCPPPIIARLAGDEFAIFFSGALAGAELDDLAARCLRLLAEPFDFGGGSLPAALTASAGAARMPEDARKYERLMAKASMAMHQAKAQGGNQVCLCDPQIIERVQDRARLEAELRLAVERGELEFAFQPKLPTSPDVRPSVEALVRWRHPQRGMLLPGSFLPLAEEAGALAQIGRWTLLEGMRVTADWARQNKPCLLSLNITVEDIRQPDFVDFVRASLAQTGASPELIEFEVTESMLMEDSPIFVERLLEVRSLGIRIAIDDFGTGYSNWARMLLLPIDCIKIDRSLVTDLAARKDYQTVVRTFVSLAEGLGFEVVAEGVENAAQAEMLKDMGCDALQGYAIARPLNEADFLEWLSCPRMAGLPVVESGQ